jgi:FkbM family methyltransferase
MAARMLGMEYLAFSVWDGEYTMLLNPRDNGISRTLAANGKREMQLRAIMDEILKPGMCVFDLGANIGYYAIYEAIKIGKSGKVYCIEPSPDNITLLKRNVALNKMEDRVEVFHYGAADKTGEAEFFLSEYSNLHTFMPNQFRCGGKSQRLLEGKTIKVPLTTVSEFIKGKRKIDLIRMDVEGFEVEVINGMQEALDQDKEFSPIVVFETHFPKYDDKQHSMRDALWKMFARGYRAAYLSSSDESKNENLSKMGYHPYKTIYSSDTHIQGLYKDVKNDDVEKLICDTGGVRDVVLMK